MALGQTYQMSRPLDEDMIKAFALVSKSSAVASQLGIWMTRAKNREPGTA